MPTIEEDFSDPEEELLPSAPAPAPKRAQKAATPRAVQYSQSAPEAAKRWTTIYPIYLDAKRPNRDGQRRVNKATAVMWPLAEAMAKACLSLGFQTVFEFAKTHPQDWENPGRCKVLLKDPNGKPVNPQIKDKRVLLARVAAIIALSQPKTPPATATNPNPLPPITLRLPRNSPAISFGTLEGSVNGGGMSGMLGNMLGVGGGDEPEEEVPVAKKKMDPRLIKPRKLHIRQR